MGNKKKIATCLTATTLLLGAVPQGHLLFLDSVSQTVQAATSKTHTVAKGDTLYSLARQYGVTVAQLKQWNNLTSNTIKIGQKLTVSGTATPSPTATKQTVHTVAKGDTLSVLSRKYGVTIAQIQQWNKLNGTIIKIGQKLVVSGETSTTAPPITSSQTSQAKVHTVAKGDTLSALSRKYGVTVAQIQQWNKLSNTTIKVGQKLIVSAPKSVMTTQTDIFAIIEAFKSHAGDTWQVELDETDQLLRIYFTMPVGLPSYEPVANNLLGALEQLNEEKGTNFDLELRGQREEGGKLILSIIDGKIIFAS